MRINNPKTTAGGLPLATTWYVNSRHAEQKEYIDNVSAALVKYTDDEVSAAIVDHISRDAQLSAKSDLHDHEVISSMFSYFTGLGDNSQFINNMLSAFPHDITDLVDPEDATSQSKYIPRPYGYAYLAANNKIDPSLMPDISIMSVTVVDIADIFVYLRGAGELAHEKALYTNLMANPLDTDNILVAVRRCLEMYVIANQSATGHVKVFGSGDMLVITNRGIDTIANDLGLDAYSPFTNVFSQSYMCGAWICSDETRVKEGERAGLNATVTFVKTSYNQGEIISVNKLVPTADGDISINLANIYKRDGAKVGNALAKNLEQIKSIAEDTNAMKDLILTGGLVATNNVNNRFVFDDDIHGNCYAYTTINEFMNLNIATETARAGLSAAIDAEVDRANKAEQFISGVVDAEIERSKNYDNYLSAVVGTEASLSGVSVTSALVGLKTHADITAANVNTLANVVNTKDYDVLKVYTTVIPAGTVANAQSLLGDLSVSAVNYGNAHPGWDADGLAQNNIYNYFGIKPSFAGADIAEIKFSGFKGKILDIYAEVDGKFEKIDADIDYIEKDVEGKTVVVGSFTILGEYAPGVEGAMSTVIDKLIVRYTDKFTYSPEAVNTLF